MADESRGVGAERPQDPAAEAVGEGAAGAVPNAVPPEEVAAEGDAEHAGDRPAVEADDAGDEAGVETAEPEDREPPAEEPAASASPAVELSAPPAKDVVRKLAAKKKGRKKPRSPLWAKLLVVVGVMLVVTSGSALAAVTIITSKVNSSVTQEDLLGDTAVADDGVDYANVDGPLNFLMIGTDSRDPDDPDAEARTDTIMVLHIPKGLAKAYLISIPRDLWVDIPRCWDGATPCQERVNAAYVFGGDTRADRFRLLAETVSGFTGLKFDGAAIINFASFKGVVDLVGGVELCLEETITSIHTFKTFEEGCKEYGSADALDIVRQRKQYTDGDFARQRMQQRFVKSLLERAGEQGYTSDPTKIGTLIAQVGKTLTVQVPNGLTPTDLAYALRGIGADDMTMLKVPTYGTTIGGAAVLIADDSATDLWHAIADDTVGAFLVEHPDLVNEDIGADGPAGTDPSTNPSGGPPTAD